MQPDRLPDIAYYDGAVFIQWPSQQAVMISPAEAEAIAALLSQAAFRAEDGLRGAIRVGPNFDVTTHRIADVAA